MPAGRPWDYLPDFDPDKPGAAVPYRQAAPAGAAGSKVAKQFADTAKDVGRQAFVGWNEGVLKAPGMIMGDLPLAGVGGTSWVLDKLQHERGPFAKYDPIGLALGAMNPSGKPRPMPTAQDFQNYPLGSQATRRRARDYLGFEYPDEPTTSLGKITRAAAEQVPAAILTGGRSAVGMSALRGGLGGAGAEVASQLFPGSAIAPFVGGLLGSFAPEVVRGTKNFFTPNMTAQAADDAERLMGMGIPVYPGQAASTPIVNSMHSTAKRLSVLPTDAVGRQDSAVNRALSRTIGQDTDNLRDAAAAGRQQMGAEYDAIRGRTVAMFDTRASRDLKRIERWAQQNVTDPSELKLVMNKIQEVRSAVARGKGAIRGQTYKTLVGEGGSLKRLTDATQPYLQQVGKDIRGAIDGMFERSMSSADAAAMRRLNTQYRHLKAYEPLVAKAPGGQVSEQRLPARLATFTQGNTAYGNAGMPVADAISKGAYLMKDVPNSGTSDRLAAAALMVGSGQINPGLMAGFAVPPLVERALESQTLMRAMIAKQRRLAGTAGARGAAPRLLPAAVGVNAAIGQGGQNFAPILPGLLAGP